MSETKRISSALISVFHKDGLDEIINKLHQEGVKLISTGGTQRFIESLGVPCQPVEELTGYPSILGGRVKTLHPKVFGGILARRDEENDMAQMVSYDIPEIDLVIVDLYPFEDTVKSGASDADIIEKIDIGGISLIRAGAKNFKDSVIVASKNQYKPLLDILNERGAETTLEERRWFAKEAFAVSSYYDSCIYNWFAGDEEDDHFRLALDGHKAMRYGENPHQNGVFHGDLDAMFDQVHGKEISYNNLLDINAAVDLIDEFSETTFAILKHNNACGVASRPTLLQAWKDALAGDPVVKLVRSALNGVLVQDKDTKIETPDDLKLVTSRKPSDDEIDDMLFANKIVKNSKSNSIVFARGKQLLASGVGQTSRVDALKQAVEKAHGFGFTLEGAAMASDAFFPFPDCVELADKAGVKNVIHPGGSVRDQESIDYCEQHEMTMVMTGFRHFKH